jgi:flagellar biogenesis protein FliO
MFGDWGALVLQFAVTAVVILGLIGVMYWLVRRYSSAGIGRVGRGRVPRLAIMDAMSIDGRRRLVLIRRDNVEHLVLIGGPTDVVVEQAIQRPRRPRSAEPETAQAPAVEEAAATPAPPPLPSPRSRASTTQNGSQSSLVAAGSETFSFRRTTPTSTPPALARTRLAEEAVEVAVAASAARYVDLQRPTRIEAPAVALPEPVEEEREPLFPALPTLDEPEPEDEHPAGYTNGAGSSHELRVDQVAEIRAPSPSPYAKPDTVAEETRGKLADLENEMARLLGEITQKRPT